MTGFRLSLCVVARGCFSVVALERLSAARIRHISDRQDDYNVLIASRPVLLVVQHISDRMDGYNVLKCAACRWLVC